ncbi:MAG: SAM-dependent methyltransferase [Bacteroidales bacterium]|nr:SAM-dependent methyltransferase [Bacteroidales bacterium]
MSNTSKDLFTLIEQSFINQSLVKLIISAPYSKQHEYKKISLRPVLIKNNEWIQCIYTEHYRDVTKNYSHTDCLNLIQDQMKAFKNLDLYTISYHYMYKTNKKGNSTLIKETNASAKPVDKAHNREKRTLIEPKNNIYLQALGVVDKKGIVLKGMGDKLAQINRYIETLEHILKQSSLVDKNDISIVDMGSGKGYLTFALFDYLSNNLGKNVSMIGVEQREELVNTCNLIAQQCGYNQLNFSQGQIADYQIDKIDILIALHACDTATDDAIYSGIAAKAEIIITAPCCHKQVRRAMPKEHFLKDITQFGILEERQAEILTDTIRALS